MVLGNFRLLRRMLLLARVRHCWRRGSEIGRESHTLWEERTANLVGKVQCSVGEDRYTKLSTLLQSISMREACARAYASQGHTGGICGGTLLAKQRRVIMLPRG
jgi:hypothetical protein